MLVVGVKCVKSVWKEQLGGDLRDKKARFGGVIMGEVLQVLQEVGRWIHTILYDIKAMLMMFVLFTLWAIVIALIILRAAR